MNLGRQTCIAPAMAVLLLLSLSSFGLSQAHLDVGRIQLIPDDGLGAVPFLKQMAGNRPMIWADWPVPITYEWPDIDEEQLGKLQFFMARAERIINVIAGAPTLERVDTLPMRNIDGEQRQYGMEVFYSTDFSKVFVDVAEQDQYSRPTKVQIRINHNGFAGVGNEATMLHELVAHALTISPEHSLDRDDLSCTGRHIGLPTAKEGAYLKLIRHVEQPAQGRADLGKYHAPGSANQVVEAATSVPGQLRFSHYLHTPATPFSLTLTNPSPQEAAGVIEYYDALGQLRDSENILIPRWGRVEASELPEGVGGYVTVNANTKLAGAARFEINQQSISVPASDLVDAAHVGATLTATTATGVALVNASDEQLDLDLRMLGFDGVEVARRTLSLEPREQIARFIHELFNEAGLPDFTAGSLHIQSDGLPFSVLALNQDLETGLSIVPASNDAIHDIPAIVTGTVIDLEGNPVAGHAVTLSYEAQSPVTDAIEEHSMIALTAADGSFTAPLKNLVDLPPFGIQIKLMAGGGQYYSYVDEINAAIAVGETSSFDTSSIQLIPVVEADGVDSLELLKFITATDGNGPNTLLETWPEFPVPITYTVPENDPATNIAGSSPSTETRFRGIR